VLACAPCVLLLARYIAEQPFQSVKQLVFDILLGQKALQSAWNPALEQGTIMVSLMNAPVIRFSFSVNIFSDHVKLAGETAAAAEQQPGCERSLRCRQTADAATACEGCSSKGQIARPLRARGLAATGAAAAQFSTASKQVLRSAMEGSSSSANKACLW
jgi:hypothetical protein